ncbi:MAG: 6-carboxytetrahydropterin synthase [Chitinophagales bacterium]|nr:6-carboxytetrahydropterin synthase [Chitinophagales bacterium]
MVYLTRKEHFNAAHKLRRDDWSDEKNAEVFGKCANKNWHGHNYDLFVTVKGEPSPETGFIMNAKELSKLIREKIVEALDHKNLDLDVPFLTGKFTSTENLVKEIWNQLEPHIKGCRLHCVKLQETDTIWCEYYGE